MNTEFIHFCWRDRQAGANANICEEHEGAAIRGSWRSTENDGSIVFAGAQEKHWGTIGRDGVLPTCLLPTGSEFHDQRFLVSAEPKIVGQDRDQRRFLQVQMWEKCGICDNAYHHCPCWQTGVKRGNRNAMMEVTGTWVLSLLAGPLTGACSKRGFLRPQDAGFECEYDDIRHFTRESCQGSPGNS